MDIAKDSSNGRPAAVVGHPQLDLVKARLASLEAQAVGYVKENPGRCIVGALAVGWLVGRLARGAWGGGRAR